MKRIIIGTAVSLVMAYTGAGMADTATIDPPSIQARLQELVDGRLGPALRQAEDGPRSGQDAVTRGPVTGSGVAKRNDCICVGNTLRGGLHIPVI